MAHITTSTKRPIAIIPLNLKESARTTQVPTLQNLSSQTSNENEIISKIDSIVSYLKTLEENFSKTKEELLKKSSFEGRENNKICAVQGKLISNKAKYYQTLESDVDSLSQTLKTSFDKINREFKQLQTLSKGKIESSSSINLSNPNPSSGSPVHRATSHFKIRYSEGPAIKNSKSGEIKVHTDINKDKPLLPFSLKTGSDQVEKIPKKVDFQGLNNGMLMRFKTFNHISSSLPTEKISRCLTANSPVHSDAVSNGNDMVLFDSPSHMAQLRSRFSQDDKNKSTSGSLSDSNAGFSDDEVSNIKSKGLNSCFQDEPTDVSLDGSRVFKL